MGFMLSGQPTCIQFSGRRGSDFSFSWNFGECISYILRLSFHLEALLSQLVPRNLPLWSEENSLSLQDSIPKNEMELERQTFDKGLEFSSSVVKILITILACLAK